MSDLLRKIGRSRLVKLPDGRKQVIDRFDVRSDAGDPATLETDVFIAFGTAHGKYTTCLLISQPDLDFSGDQRVRQDLVRVYEEIHASNETQVGLDSVSEDANGRHTLSRASIQLSSATYVEGTAGATLTANSINYALVNVSKSDNGAVRNITRTYVEVTSSVTQVGAEIVTTDENGRKNVVATFVQLASASYTDGVVGTTAAPTTANCVLSSERVDANSAVRTITRSYVQATSTLTQVGSESVTTDENNRKRVQAIFIQLTSATYTDGVVGTTAAPTTANCVLIGEQKSATSAVRTVVRNYIEATATLTQVGGETITTNENDRKSVQATFIQLASASYTAGTIGTTAAPTTANCVLSGERVEVNAAVRTVVRAYVEATSSLTQVGGETVTTDENGRKSVQATFIQLTSASYTDGVIGTTAAPTTADCILSGERVEVNSTVRSVVRSYVQVTATLTQIGAEKVTQDANGRKQVQAVYIQLTSATYTPGVVGTTAAPTTADCLLSGEQVDASSVVRTVVRSYIQATATLTQIGAETVTTDEQGRKQVQATFIQLTSATYTPGTVGTTAAPTTADCILSGERVEANAVVRSVTRSYIQATASLVQVGAERVTTDENGRKRVQAVFIQLTSATYTPGTVGTTAAPTTANCILTAEDVEANAAVRTVTRTYLEATSSEAVVGQPIRSLGEDGREEATITFIQLASATYVPGTINSDTPPSPYAALGYLARAQHEASAAIRTIRRVYVVAGLLSTSSRQMGGGVLEVTYQSVRTESTPSGLVVSRTTQDPNGLPKYTVTALQRYDGGDLTSGTVQTYGKRVNFTYPGRAKPYYYDREYFTLNPITYGGLTTVLGITRFLDVFLSPPITTAINATVDVTYSTSASPTGYGTYWAPTSWATMNAAWFQAWTGGRDTNSRVEGLVGYRAVAPTQASVACNDNISASNPTGLKIYPVVSGVTAYTPDTLVTQGGNPYVASIFGGSVRYLGFAQLTVTGGPVAPDGNTYTLDYDVEDAFVTAAGVRYYRHVRTYATIPAQDALPI